MTNGFDLHPGATRKGKSIPIEGVVPDSYDVPGVSADVSRYRERALCHVPFCRFFEIPIDVDRTIQLTDNVDKAIHDFILNLNGF